MRASVGPMHKDMQALAANCAILAISIQGYRERWGGGTGHLHDALVHQTLKPTTDKSPSAHHDSPLQLPSDGQGWLSVWLGHRHTLLCQPTE